jgi:hypothetical protein
VLSLSELLDPGGAKLCREFLAQLAKAPVKKCDALVGCENEAQFWVDFHGCYSCCICDEHLKAWVLEVNSAISQGGAFCDECRIVFSLLPRTMSWRLI